jgi:hypothetical protein
MLTDGVFSIICNLVVSVTRQQYAKIKKIYFVSFFPKFCMIGRNFVITRMSRIIKK